MRDSFIFYRSFFEAVEQLDDKDQLVLYKSVSAYALNGEEPDLEGAVRAVFTLIKPQIDANARKYENGKKGASYGIMGGRPAEKNRGEFPCVSEKTPEKPRHNPKETPGKPQGNPRETPNGNVNSNPHENPKEECGNGNANGNVKGNASTGMAAGNPQAVRAFSCHAAETVYGTGDSRDRSVAGVDGGVRGHAAETIAGTEDFRNGGEYGKLKAKSFAPGNRGEIVHVYDRNESGHTSAERFETSSREEPVYFERSEPECARYGDDYSSTDDPPIAFTGHAAETVAETEDLRDRSVAGIARGFRDHIPETVAGTKDFRNGDGYGKSKAESFASGNRGERETFSPDPPPGENIAAPEFPWDINNLEGANHAGPDCGGYAYARAGSLRLSEDNKRRSGVNNLPRGGPLGLASLSAERGKDNERGGFGNLPGALSASGDRAKNFGAGGLSHVSEYLPGNSRDKTSTRRILSGDDFAGKFAGDYAAGERRSAAGSYPGVRKYAGGTAGEHAVSPESVPVAKDRGDNSSNARRSAEKIRGSESSEAAAFTGTEKNAPESSVHAPAAGGFSNYSRAGAFVSEADPPSKRTGEGPAKSAGDPKDRELDELFSTLWKAYPKKVKHTASYLTFRDMAFRGVLPEADELLEAVEIQKGSFQWRDARYVPNLDRWLKEERWTDVLPAADEGGEPESEIRSEIEARTKWARENGYDESDIWFEEFGEKYRAASGKTAARAN